MSSFTLLVLCVIALVLGSRASVLSSAAASAKASLLKYISTPPPRDSQSTFDASVRAKVSALIAANEPDTGKRHLQIETALRSCRSIDGEWIMSYSSLFPLQRVPIKSLFAERAIESEEIVQLTSVTQVWNHISPFDSTSLLLPMSIDNCVHILFEKNTSSLPLHHDVPGLVVTRGYCTCDPFIAEREPGSVRLRTVWHEQDAVVLSTPDDGHTFDSLVGLPHDSIIVTKFSQPLQSDSWVLYIDSDLRIHKGQSDALIILCK